MRWTLCGGRRCAEKASIGLARAKIPKLGRNLKKLFAPPPAAAMSLYYEAAAILANADKVGGSLKSRIYTKKELKSPPAQIFALIAETSKWSIVLKDVIEKCRLLAEERKVRVE
jgi:hypothetical protein